MKYYLEIKIRKKSLTQRFDVAMRSLPRDKIEKNLLNWFISYLSCRKQRVIIDEVHSDWRNIEAGVHQGSVLVPLLFLVYINNLRATISSRFFYLQMIAFCRKKFSLLVIALLSLIMTWHQYLIGLNGGWWLWMKLRLNQLFFGKKRYTFSPLFDFEQ